MSRSRKKNPGAGYTSAESDRWGKQWANRLYRRACKRALQLEQELPRWVTMCWNFPKDGKQWFACLRWRRPDIYEKEMRK